MRITVLGASGRTGVPLVEQALDRGHEVVAFVRSRDRLPADLLDRDGVTVVAGDAYTGDGVAEAVEGADVVVSVLGQSKGSPDDLLTVAGDHVVEAMGDAGVDRFVTLVGAGVREEGEAVPFSGKVMGAVLKFVASEVLADAEVHVERVRDSDLRWTIVRAPRLTDATGTGTYRAGDIPLGFESIARADVARFLLDVVEGEQFVGELPKVGPA
jgi:putative NADH-flavin reductase